MKHLTQRIIVAALCGVVFCAGVDAHARSRSYSARFAPAREPAAPTLAGKTSVGAMFGAPTGVTLKYWAHSSNAIQVATAYSFGGYLALMCDYLWHFDLQFVAGLRPYVGFGGASLFVSNSYANHEGRYGGTELAGRLPAGVEWLPRKLPIGVFAEFVPALTIAPSVQGFVQGDVGIRFFM
ncbi:MAG: hypothetical protein HY075_15415 [Deltaproteobacteria bacterium]|nr:hypothetical protein [Deltaproteobacteria bacterium]